MKEKENILSIVEDLLECIEQVKDIDYEVYDSLKYRIKFIENLIREED